MVLDDKKGIEMHNDIKTNALLTILLALLLIGLMVANAEQLYVFNKSNGAMKSAHDERMIALSQLNAIYTANLRNRLAVASAVYHPDDMPNYIQEIENNKSVIDKQWETYTATFLRNAPTDEEGKQLIARFAEIRGRFVEEVIKPALAAMRANKLGELKQIHEKHIDPLNAPLNEAMNALIDKQIRDAKTMHEASILGILR